MKGDGVLRAKMPSRTNARHRECVGRTDPKRAARLRVHRPRARHHVRKGRAARATESTRTDGDWQISRVRETVGSAVFPVVKRADA